MPPSVGTTTTNHLTLQGPTRWCGLIASDVACLLTIQQKAPVTDYASRSTDDPPAPARMSDALSPKPTTATLEAIATHIIQLLSSNSYIPSASSCAMWEVNLAAIRYIWPCIHLLGTKEWLVHLLSFLPFFGPHYLPEPTVLACPKLSTLEIAAGPAVLGPLLHLHHETLHS